MCKLRGFLPLTAGLGYVSFDHVYTVFTVRIIQTCGRRQSPWCCYTRNEHVYGRARMERWKRLPPHRVLDHCGSRSRGIGLIIYDELLNRPWLALNCSWLSLTVFYVEIGPITSGGFKLYTPLLYFRIYVKYRFDFSVSSKAYWPV